MQRVCYHCRKSHVTWAELFRLLQPAVSCHPQKLLLVRPTSNLQKLWALQYAAFCTPGPRRLVEKDLTPEKKDLVTKERLFHVIQKKDKESFLKVVETFKGNLDMKRGHVEFIYAAMRLMEEFGVHRDLETYKKLLDILPKGKMIPRNMIQAEFFHFPRQQDCAIDLLDQMECNGIVPDMEVKEMILNIFGRSSHVFKKYARMMYWMPKLLYRNPYLLPDPLPSDIEQLAELALKKMSVDPRTKITHFKTEDLDESVDKTWIVSSQSVVQQRLLYRHPVDQPIFVEGPFIVWMRRLSVSYFILKALPPTRPEIDIDDDDVSNLSLYMFGEPKPKELLALPTSVHEQEDGTIFGMCATGTSSKDSVLAWVRFLRKSNCILSKIPVLFTFKSLSTALVTVNNSSQELISEDDMNDATNSTDVNEDSALPNIINK